MTETAEAEEKTLSWYEWVSTAGEEAVEPSTAICPYSQHAIDLNVEKQKDQVMVYAGALFAGFILLWAMVDSPNQVTTVIAMFFLSLGLYLFIALLLGGFKKVTVWGDGTLKDEIGNVNLNAQDAQLLNQYYQKHAPPSYSHFLPLTIESEKKKRMYEALCRDLEVGLWVQCQEERIPFQKLLNNRGYVAMFLCASIPMFFLLCLTEGQGLDWLRPGLFALVFLVTVEELAKASVLFTTRTRDGRLLLFGKELPPEFSKGIVVGCGYAWIESFTRVFKGPVDPFVSGVVRLITIIPHTLSSGLMAVAVYMFLGDAQRGVSFREEFRALLAEHHPGYYLKGVFSLPYWKNIIATVSTLWFIWFFLDRNTWQMQALSLFLVVAIVGVSIFFIRTAFHCKRSFWTEYKSLKKRGQVIPFLVDLRSIPYVKALGLALAAITLHVVYNILAKPIWEVLQ